jgi:hypothetical protein
MLAVPRVMHRARMAMKPVKPETVGDSRQGCVFQKMLEEKCMLVVTFPSMGK